jgi:hypothetical protein
MAGNKIGGRGWPEMGYVPPSPWWGGGRVKSKTGKFFFMQGSPCVYTLLAKVSISLTRFFVDSDSDD